MLHIVTANDLYSLSRRDADIALRASTQPPEDLIGQRIATLAHAVYGATRYLAPRRAVQDLRAHDWIALDDSMSRQATLKWMARIRPPEQAVLRCNSYVGVQTACVEGLGLAVLPCFMGDRQPLLERVTATLEDCRNELWLLMHLALRDTVRFKAVFQLIRNEVGQAASELEGVSTGRPT